ncbi:putative disease resistance protein RGA3 [Salvia splendens]|uniref:putative disease resistance protein RGA3 n=1 Tax=Salvia splendens TaxID=180675 RepID=UPI001C2795AF|nr:putative disease resistance protein RGA3 [Salvia splendens]
MGMSGIGNTADANFVYCDGSINFHLKIWVSVSVGFDVIWITKCMIEYATLAPCNLSDLPPLQRVLENIPYCKKILLVLDDYWSENCDEWDALSRKGLSESVLEEPPTITVEGVDSKFKVADLHSTQIDSKLFSHLKFLKVLGLSGAKLTVLVESMTKLEYLRYLNLSDSDNPIAKLPVSMCSLLLLQILKLRDCPNLTELPKHMTRLTNLRHVVLDEDTIQRMPPEFGKLTQLQHLSVYVSSKDSGCGIVELKDLNCLRRSLHIRNIEVVTPA